MTVLIIAEHNNQTLKAATLNCVTAAQQIDNKVDILIIGYNCQSVANQAAKIKNVNKILLCDDISYKYGLAENTAEFISTLASSYNHILAAATSYGKSYMPRLAAMLDVSQISEITSVQSPSVFTRLIYAGNALATVETQDKIKILTVRTASFEAFIEQASPVAIEKVETKPSQSLSQFVSEELSKSERPELNSAKIIVAGGRGLQSGENFKLLEKLADRLGAAVGASRAAVDAGYVPNDYQVGQTGKVVAPDLYIAVGISGAIQHLAGMKDSKIIVAINKDPDAPIFQIADYGLVGDLFEIIPDFLNKLN
ncbi:MAG: FAD-binding protein [Alphaproteobacteria bacterium]|nr:FAD-binding protein [Alphaproteobacteria bacterium]